MLYIVKYFIGVVEYIYFQLWMECFFLIWFEDIFCWVYSFVCWFICMLFIEDEEIKCMVDVVVIVDCFVNKVWVDVGRGICKVLKVGQIKCFMDDFEIFKIFWYLCVENNLKDMYKIWFVFSYKSDFNVQVVVFIEVDFGLL